MTSSKSPSLTEQAYAIIRRRIIKCQLVPGREISEQALAEELEMSKTPVREALGRLGLEGYVETYPRRGYRIRPITLKDINDLFDVRVMLEPAAAALASARLSREEIEVIDQLGEASYAPDEEPSLDGFIAANREFHTAIAQGSGNPRLTALVVSHLEESERFFYVGARSRDVNFETSTGHNMLIESFRRKDPPTASRIMANHIENTRKGISASLMNSELVELSI